MAPLAAAAPTVTPDLVARQGYLDPAPGGIDARFAWTFPGGRGAGIRVIDIEGAWRFSHEDLLMNHGGVVGGVEINDVGWRNHGTAVVGQIGGDQNGFGVTGICPDANVRAISHAGPGWSSSLAIRRAADLLSPGDILLLEMHRPGPRFNFTVRDDQRGYIAVEWWPDDYDAILYASRKGVLVVEAAGNGAEDLDDPLYDRAAAGFPATWRNPFRRGTQDSGAIVVGAGAPPPGTHAANHGPDRSRLDFSNHGALVDAQAWGREVTTCGYGDLQGGAEDTWYTDRFSGTSSASPIVVGALGCVQGVLRAHQSPLLTPARARQLLRSTGSPQQAAPTRPVSQRIGNRPDLRQLINEVLQRPNLPVLDFPAREQTLQFVLQLEEFYRDRLGREGRETFLDAEGIAVWLQQYIFYRASGRNHAPAVESVLEDIGRALPPARRRAKARAARRRPSMPRSARGRKRRAKA